jgi:hypothetical protein
MFRLLLDLLDRLAKNRSISSQAFLTEVQTFEE